MINTNDRSLADPQYASIIKLLQGMIDDGTVHSVENRCFEGAYRVQSLLKNKLNIVSDILHCTCLLRYFNDTEEKNIYIGYAHDQVIKQFEEQIHCIVVVRSLVPLLIDCSINHLLPPHHQIVVELLNMVSEPLGHYHHRVHNPPNPDYDYELTYRTKVHGEGIPK